MRTSVEARPRARWQTALDGLLVSLVATVAVMAAMVPGSSAAFVGRITNDPNTVASGYFSCTSYARAGGAYYAYPLDDTIIAIIGISARDVSGNNRPGTYQGLPTHSTSSPCRDGGGSTTFNGSSQYVTTPNQITNPQVFTIEVWFRTTMAGGLLVGFQNLQTGLGNSYDRQIYMTNAGKLVFGVFPNGTTVTVTSANSYNDGAWHYAAATLGSAGMRLYVDGALVASNANTGAQVLTGYWRAGFGNLNGWPASPTNYYFNGQLGYFTYYQTALSDAVIASHDTAGA